MVCYNIGIHNRGSGSSFALGLANGLTTGLTFGTLALAARGGYYNTGLYNNYLDTCYADLDSPSGMTSWLDGGYMINNYGYIGDSTFVGGYHNGYTGFSYFGMPVSCGIGYGGLGLNSFAFGTGLGLGMGWGLYC
ncbi:MAG: hypothetical protein LUB59_07615 [Candidatus Gastranaerophilales bacterium]|nr:hypothetical protein [Candidatus Gastranaerophilales bacterium]